MRKEDMRIYAMLSKHAVVLSYCTRLLDLDYSYDLSQQALQDQYPMKAREFGSWITLSRRLVLISIRVLVRHLIHLNWPIPRFQPRLDTLHDRAALLFGVYASSTCIRAR